MFPFMVRTVSFNIQTSPLRKAWIPHCWMPPFVADAGFFLPAIVPDRSRVQMASKAGAQWNDLAVV